MNAHLVAHCAALTNAAFHENNFPPCRDWCEGGNQNQKRTNKMTTATPHKPRIPYGAATEGAVRILKQIADRTTRQAKVIGFHPTAIEARREDARETALIFETEMCSGQFDAHGVPKMKPEYYVVPLEAATDADNLGTLAGTLVLQRFMQLFRYKFPLLRRILTDFSDEPGELNQAVNTRKLLVPAVQSFDNTLDTDGRPKGWAIASAMQSTDIAITMDELVGVPIPFSMATLSSTRRNLFEEANEAAVYALVKYFLRKIFGVCTAANFNAYAAVTPADADGIVKVPTAYPTYAVSVVDFSRSKVVQIGAAFDANEVPEEDRSLLLNADYYAKGTTDPSLVAFYAGQQRPEIIERGILPHLNDFALIKAPFFPGSNNRVGIALQKNGLIARSRIPTDLNKVLPGAAVGSTIVITDPETGFTMLQINYSNPGRGFAEMLPCAIIGAAKADTRGGMVVTSQ